MTRSLCWSTRGASCLCSRVATVPSRRRLALFGFPTRSRWLCRAPGSTGSRSAWRRCWISPISYGGSRSTILSTSAWRSSSSSPQVRIQPKVMLFKEEGFRVSPFRCDRFEGTWAGPRLSGEGGSVSATIHDHQLLNNAFEVRRTPSQNPRTATRLSGGFHTRLLRIIVIKFHSISISL